VSRLNLSLAAALLLAVLAGDGFHPDGSFDARMTCDGAGDYSPPLVFRHLPRGAVELVLSMVDDDKLTLLALSKAINLPYGAPARTVLAAAEPPVLGTATFVATYHRAG
jgi:phosphatidylethanolamine-binding protein (PEBP) family uncharacterized protein